VTRNKTTDPTHTHRILRQDKALVRAVEARATIGLGDPIERAQARLLLFVYKRWLRGMAAAPSWMVEETLSASVLFHQPAISALSRRNLGLGVSKCGIGAHMGVLYRFGMACARRRKNQILYTHILCGFDQCSTLCLRKLDMTRYPSHQLSTLTG
jgi:hypothetical protein